MKFKDFKATVYDEFAVRPIAVDNLSTNELYFLSNADEFYTQLVESIRAARKQIILASLYLGDGRKENVLIDLLEEKLKTVPDIEICIILDKWRSLRNIPKSTVGSLMSNPTIFNSDYRQKFKNGYFSANPILAKSEQTPLHDSSIEKLLELATKYKNLHISLHSPQNNSHALIKLLPGKIKEIFGVMHCKFYAFDGKVILSGANLSHDYFTSRIDRYMVIPQCQELVNHFLLAMQNLTSSSPTQLETIAFENSDSSCFFVPIFQSVNCNLDYRMIQFLCTQKWQNPLYISSAYFNFPTSLDTCHINFLLPSIESHGFHRSTGLTNLIPTIYQSFARQHLEKPHSSIFQLQSHSRMNATKIPCIHAKGLWARGEDFLVTLVGSSNFNYRSYCRDVEFQLLVAVKLNTSVAVAIEKDFERLFKLAVPMTKTQFKPVSFCEKILLRVVRSFF